MEISFAVPAPVYDDAELTLAGSVDEFGNLPFVVTLKRGDEPIVTMAHTVVFALRGERPFIGGAEGIQTTGVDDLGMTIANAFGNPSGLMQCLYRGTPVAGQINHVASAVPVSRHSRGRPDQPRCQRHVANRVLPARRRRGVEQRRLFGSATPACVRITNDGRKTVR